MKNSVLLWLLLLSVKAVAQNVPFSLHFDPTKYQTQTLNIGEQTVTVRAYENLVYVANPVDTAYQKMNIYIPEAYFKGESINGYTAQNAPIFFPNKVGGYMPAKPATPQDKPMGMRSPSPMPAQPSALLVALSKGYIVASAGARGRVLKDNKGVFSGKAPAGIVDLKAAIRFLKFNDANMPGDAHKIISNGTSAGGAMSTLLGATGNNPDYEPYLQALGAAKAKDDIFAVSAYCPITNLDHADMAYEWQFYGINTYKGWSFGGGNVPTKNLSDAQINVSAQLKVLFPAYLNALKLKDKQGNLLSLDDAGNGNFKTLVASYIIASAQKELNKNTDLSAFTFLTIRNNVVESIDFDAYLKHLGRQKTPPAFDALDMSSPENSLFGTATTDSQHFTTFGKDNTLVEAQTANQAIIRMMNPMNYVGQKNTTTAKHWRIRHGSKDKDTSLSISVMLATLLDNKGYDVNLAFPWERPHSGDYDIDELFQWIDALCKQ